MAARHKLWAEGQLEESIMILGWLWDFQRLPTSLPDNKYIALMGEINNMINKRSVTTKELEFTIGRLTHTSMISLLYIISSVAYASYIPAQKETIVTTHKSPSSASMTLS